MNLKKAVHSIDFYFVGLCMLVVGLPLSRFLLSVSQFMLAIAWLQGGGYQAKFKRFWNNKPACLMVGVYLVHLFGLLYTSNFDYASKDLRIKLPLLVLPFIIASLPRISIIRFRQLLWLFIAAIFTSTLISTAVWAGITTHKYTDIRQISIFISHIRFSLLICIAFFGMAYMLYTKQVTKPIAVMGALLLMLWLVLFLMLMQALTGLLMLLFVSLLVLVYFLWKTRKIYVRIGLCVIMIGIPLSIAAYVAALVVDYDKVKDTDTGHFDKYTSYNHLYVNNFDNSELENNHRVWVYLCEEELKQTWDGRSGYSYNGKDARGQSLYVTLIRFLASKGLRKDAKGVMALSNKEIQAIELGTTSVNELQAFGLKNRLNVIIWELKRYRAGVSPSGNSITQRFEYWRAALSIIKENLLLGVGTGDLNDAFLNEYNRTNSPLELRWRLHAHNQYLAIACAFGLLGLAYFIFSLLYPLLYKQQYRNYFYLVFWLIAIISMFTEDTLETQAGATFFAFFNAFFLFGVNFVPETLDEQAV